LQEQAWSQAKMEKYTTKCSLLNKLRNKQYLFLLPIVPIQGISNKAVLTNIMERSILKGDLKNKIKSDRLMSSYGNSMENTAV
jgi:hypothetical protein